MNSTFIQVPFSLANISFLDKKRSPAMDHPWWSLYLLRQAWVSLSFFVVVLFGENGFIQNFWNFEQVGLLNVDGYYNSLLALFDKGVEEGFIEDPARHIVISADTAEELIKKMEVIMRERVSLLIFFGILSKKLSIELRYSLRG